MKKRHLTLASALFAAIAICLFLPGCTTITDWYAGMTGGTTSSEVAAIKVKADQAQAKLDQATATQEALAKQQTQQAQQAAAAAAAKQSADQRANDAQRTVAALAAQLGSTPPGSVAFSGLLAYLKSIGDQAAQLAVQAQQFGDVAVQAQALATQTKADLEAGAAKLAKYQADLANSQAASDDIKARYKNEQQAAGGAVVNAIAAGANIAAPGSGTIITGILGVLAAIGIGGTIKQTMGKTAATAEAATAKDTTTQVLDAAHAAGVLPAITTSGALTNAAAQAVQTWLADGPVDAASAPAIPPVAKS